MSPVLTTRKITTPAMVAVLGFELLLEEDAGVGEGEGEGDAVGFWRAVRAAEGRGVAALRERRLTRV
jgi:hypothetical protein